MFAAVDWEEIAAMVLLDVSAAYDTVDHDIQLERIVAEAHSWIRSYPAGQIRLVCRGDVTSSTTTVDWGVSQGSVLRPVLIFLYTTDQQSVTHCNATSSHVICTPTMLKSTVGAVPSTSTDWQQESPVASLTSAAIDERQSSTAECW